MADGISDLERVIRQAGIRNNVLASNIANVDTPGYRAKDVTFGQVLDSELSMTTTDPGHMTGTSSPGGTGEVVAEDTQPWADRNNVELDQEVAKMTENAMLFQTGVTLLQKKIQMFKSAIKTTG